MYISSGGGSGKGSALPNQQSNSASTTPGAPHNAALQQPIYPQHLQSVVMPPAFHAQYIPRQPASQIYSTTPPIHFPQTQMPPNFTSYSYFFTNSLISTQHRPSIIQSGVAHNPSHLALPSVNMVAPNVPPQTSCQPPIHPPSGNSFPGKKRSHALPIINPITKRNIMEEFELSKNVGLDSKQQTKPSETEGVSKPRDISSGLPQNQKLKKTSTIGGSKEIITEPHADKGELPSKITSNVDLKEEKLITTVKYDRANQDFSKNSKNNTEIGREQPAQKDVDTQCSNLQNENRTKNQSSTNHPNGEQVSKERANISHNKPICDKSVESIIGSQVNVASTKFVKLQSNIVERSIERKKHGVERQRKKSQSLENVEKRISDNSKKKNYREEDLKRKDRVENKNVSTDISITKKSPQSDDSKDSSVLCPSGKEVKPTHPAKEELNVKIIVSDKLESQKTKNELIHSKEIKETSTDIRKECAKPNVISSKTHSPGSSQNSSSFQMFYKDGQWSPSNLQGKKIYDLQQLHLLNNSPLSKVKPKLKKVIGIVSDNPKTSGRSYKNSHAFVNNNEFSSLQTSNKSGSKIGSNQAKLVSKPNKPGIIHVRLSLRENIKLSETENAWRPSHFKALDESTPNIQEKEELFRKVRGILNKLTPEKFDALVEEIMKLQIDTSEKINGVMMLVFEKAIDEPNFSASYARLCQRVADKNALCNNDEKTETKKTSSLVPFKTALLDKTEREFNVNVIDLHAKNAKLKPTVDELKKCNDSKKKQELQIILEEQEYLLRKRSCGTVRFIGELFKMSMLTGNIIKTCVYKLLDSKSEDKLECLCKLLTTVGKKFEKTLIGKMCGEQCLDDVIRKMQSIVDRKVDGTKVSNRVRFMLQDVIDLRRNNWMTNHRSDPQKLPESLQNEHQIITSSAYNSSSNKRGDRTYDSRASSHSSNEHSSRGKGTYTCEESWFKHSKGSHMVDTNKLKPIFQTENMFKLGDSSHYQWRRDRAGSTQAETKERFLTQVPDSTLQRMKSGGVEWSEAEERRHNGKKGLILNLPSIPKSNSQTNIHTPKSATLPKKIKSATTVNSTLSICPTNILSAPTDISENDNKLITDVLNRLVDTAEEESIDSCLVIWSEFPKKLYWALIYNIFTDYLHLRKVKPATRQILSKIVLHLIHGKHLLLQDFEKGYLEFSKIANEIVIDVPDAWKYIFEFIGDFIIKETMSVRLFWNQHLIDIGMGKYFLKNCISYFVREKGYNYARNLWQSENFEWKQFLNERDVTKFIEENKFQFLNSKENAESSTTMPDAASAIKRIKEFLQDDNSTPEDIMEYLNQNNPTVNNEFVGNLSLALCESAIVRNPDNSHFNQSFFLKKCIPLLRRYIDSKEDKELRCLSTIADFAQGFDDTDNLISGIFYELYEADVISQDSFLKWRNTKKQLLEKRIPLLGLNRFFNLFQYNSEASDEN